MKRDHALRETLESLVNETSSDFVRKELSRIIDIMDFMFGMEVGDEERFTLNKKSNLVVNARMAITHHITINIMDPFKSDNPCIESLTSQFSIKRVLEDYFRYDMSYIYVSIIHSGASHKILSGVTDFHTLCENPSNFESEHYMPIQVFEYLGYDIHELVERFKKEKFITDEEAVKIITVRNALTMGEEFGGFD